MPMAAYSLSYVNTEKKDISFTYQMKFMIDRLDKLADLPTLVVEGLEVTVLELSRLRARCRDL